jgi:hypothetical protein
MTIAADPRHFGARIGITAVLPTWGSAMSHHPHIHMMVPGGGISLDGERWIASRPAFLLPVHILSKLFRQLFLRQRKSAVVAIFQCPCDTSRLNTFRAIVNSSCAGMILTSTLLAASLMRSFA